MRRLLCRLAPLILVAGTKATPIPSPSFGPATNERTESGVGSSLEAPLQLATGEDFPPYADSSRPDKGLSVALVEKVLRHARIPYSLSFVPWNRAERGAAGGDYAGLFPYIRSPEREAQFYFSDPIHMVVAKFFVRAASKVVIRSLDDALGLTLCKPLGYAFEESLQPFIANGKIKAERPLNMRSCLRMLLAGRVDAVSEGEQVFWQTVTQMAREKSNQDVRPSQFKALNLVIQRTALHFITSKKHPRGRFLVDSFDKALRDLKKDGKLVAEEAAPL